MVCSAIYRRQRFERLRGSKLGSDESPEFWLDFTKTIRKPTTPSVSGTIGNR
jgi:hypothetical protein